MKNEGVKKTWREKCGVKNGLLGKNGVKISATMTRKSGVKNGVKNGVENGVKNGVRKCWCDKRPV